MTTEQKPRKSNAGFEEPKEYLQAIASLLAPIDFYDMTQTEQSIILLFINAGIVKLNEETGEITKIKCFVSRLNPRKEHS